MKKLFFINWRRDEERFYHGFVLGLIVELAGKYKVSSNRESGLGRYDVMLELLDRTKPAYILEFKVRNAKRQKTLEGTLQAALKQMKEKGYDRELIGGEFPKKISGIMDLPLTGKKF